MEKWIKIEKGYEISSLGRIKNKKGKILKQSDNGKGYKKVSLSGIGQKYIHRLVAQYFLTNPENKRTVNHIDGNKSNNNVSNLEWATYSENQIHAKNSGLCKFGENHPQHSLTNEQVKYIRENYKPRDKEFSCNALARKFDKNPGAISNIINMKTRKRG